MHQLGHGDVDVKGLMILKNIILHYIEYILVSMEVGAGRKLLLKRASFSETGVVRPCRSCL